MIAALYARISTSEGRQFAENQLIECRRFAERSGWTVVREYIDEASGSRADRDALAEMLADAHARRFDHLVVFALDRMTREGVIETFQYLDRLKQSKVTFWSVNEPHFCTAGPFGEVMIAFSAWVAKQESLRLSERIRAGQARAKAAGVVFGRPRGVFDILKAKELRSAGLSYVKIGQECGVSHSVIHRFFAAQQS